MATRTKEAEQVVREYASIWNERAFSRLAEVVAESFTFTSPTAGPIHGRDEFEVYARAVVSGFSDFEVTSHEMVSDGRIVMTESTLSGTHDGEFNGVPPTGKSLEIQSMAKFVVEDGELQSERTYFDQQEFLSQLGLVEG